MSQYLNNGYCNGAFSAGFLVRALLRASFPLPPHGDSSWVLQADVGWSEVDHHRPGCELEAAVANRGADPLAALPDCSVRQTHDLRLGQAVVQVDLDLNRNGFDSPRGGRSRTGEHRL